METKFIDLFSTYLGKVFETACPTNFTYDIVEEYTNRNDVDCLVVIKQLTPTFQHNVKNIPYQLMIECNNKYVENIKKELDDIAIEMDGQTSITFATYLNTILTNQISLDTIPNEHYFLSGCSVLGTFVDKGLYQATTLTMSINVIVAEETLAVSDVKLDNNSIDILSFTFAYAGNPDASGLISKNGKIEASMLNASITFSITCMAKTNLSTIITNMLGCDNVNAAHTLSFSIGGSTISRSCLIANGGLSQNYNGFTTIQITLMVKEW